MDPVHLLSTLQTPRCRGACKTRCWPVCSTLTRPDFHRQVDTSFPTRSPQCRYLVAHFGREHIVHLSRVLTPAAHDGTIIPDRPDAMWGTDATSALTAEGPATIFIAVDHFTAECVGIHATRHGTRFEALEPLRQGIRQHFGNYGAGIAAGLALRHDHGSQFLSHAYQAELRFLGIRSSPAFLREPEGNGCAERFIRTLKEQLLWVESFAMVTDRSASDG